MSTDIRTEKVGPRLYVAGNTYAIKAELNRLGCHWDGDRKQWWIGAAKAASLQSFISALGEPVMVATEGSAVAAAAVGLSPDTPAGIVADALAEQGREREAVRVRAGKPAQEDPDTIKLTGKGRYKGREYYAGAVTRDGAKVRLLTLPDADGKYLDFWAPCSEVVQTKKYEPRTKWNGARGRFSRDVEVHTTLGSIASFVAKQKRNQGTGRERVQCIECGAWHNASEACSECGGC